MRTAFSLKLANKVFVNSTEELVSAAGNFFEKRPVPRGSKLLWINTNGGTCGKNYPKTLC